jgi:hypothetical protein
MPTYQPNFAMFIAMASIRVWYSVIANQVIPSVGVIENVTAILGFCIPKDKQAERNSQQKAQYKPKEFAFHCLAPSCSG